MNNHLMLDAEHEQGNGRSKVPARPEFEERRLVQRAGRVLPERVDVLATLLHRAHESLSGHGKPMGEPLEAVVERTAVAWEHRQSTLIAFVRPRVAQYTGVVTTRPNCTGLPTP